MHIYRLTRVPSVADYVRGLSCLKVRDDQLRLFQCHYNAPQRTATATELARLAGIQGGHPVVNSNYYRLAKAFCKQMNLPADIGRDGKSRWFTFWAQGWTTPQGFVWEMLPQVAEAFELLGWVRADGAPLPDEVTVGERFVEGSVRQIVVNAYERNPLARARCVAHYGPKCVVCGFDFDFATTYGPVAEGFIHVHHLKPLHEIGDAYEVDPIADLRPVCANCHCVIHLDGGCRSIEEVQRLVDARAAYR